MFFFRGNHPPNKNSVSTAVFFSNVFPFCFACLLCGQVPALGDSSASLVLSSDDPFSLETKPHGHGDVHHLLLREGVAEKLKGEGFEWLFFFQDTNALVGFRFRFRFRFRFFFF